MLLNNHQYNCNITKSFLSVDVYHCFGNCNPQCNMTTVHKTYYNANSVSQMNSILLVIALITVCHMSSSHRCPDTLICVKCIYHISLLDLSIHICCIDKCNITTLVQLETCQFRLLLYFVKY